MDKLKILIADSNSTYRRMISEAVERTGLGITEHVASNGAIAIEWLRHCHMDLVLMDVSILETEGLQVLEKLKRETEGLEVVIMSTTEPGNATVTLEALELGALDFMLKPAGDRNEIIDGIKYCLQSLLAQISVRKYTMAGEGIAAQSAKGRKSTGTAERDVNARCCTNSAPVHFWRGADMVLIAASTGGPQALEKVLEGLPADFKKPILVVQHMPPDFTRILAQSLDKKCRLRVTEAFDSAPVEDGRIVIAPGGFHMTVEANCRTGKFIRLQNTPLVNGVKPSADVLFRGVAEVYKGARILAVILTGMGTDGTSGIAEIKRNCNCYCITQSEQTCVVYGMPRSVYETGLSDEVADIEEISGRIMQLGSFGG